TAYFDESGTHGSDSPAILMTGFIGSGAGWSAFEQRFGQHLASFGVAVYHAKRLHHSQRSFKGWTIDKKLAFHDGMVRIIDETLCIGMGAVWRTEGHCLLLQPGSLSPKIPKAWPVGRWFWVCMIFAGEYARENGAAMNFVLEEGAKNGQDAV